MVQEFDSAAIPSSLSVDFTISKCKRKLLNLHKFVRSYYRDKYQRSLNSNLSYMSKNNPIMTQSVGFHNAYRSRKDKAHEYLENYFSDSRNNYFTEINSEICSESSISYDNSFVNKMIEKYRHSVGFNMKDPSRNVSIPDRNEFNYGNNCSNSMKSNENLLTGLKNSKIVAKKDDEDMNSQTYLPKINNDSISREPIWKQNHYVSPGRTLVNHFDLETREIVENIERKIEKLEDIVQDCSDRICHLSVITNNSESEHIYMKHYKRLESKIISMAMFPPRGIHDYESSFDSYYCTFGEIDALKELISVNTEFHNSSNSLYIKRVGKMYCYFARRRFINFVRYSPNNVNSLLKLKLLFFMGEPEILLANTFGQYPIEVKQNYDFCGWNATNKLKNIARFLICLVAIETDYNNELGIYPIKDMRQVLPIYIIDNS
ncbi:hypothetical protein FG386_003039 [Cryptosporidium ryanae]|uniref:uncharacterized protein n=1 Tax=Cryptosporidium ryanae TaxID=515981 RepID=UPI00351A9634|nr:hypothetical protein FG386_003039 [Cryptosporidium ryanae]